ncbi:hypothetical protein Dtox_2456 [Desulfofarcimen acetoxidans DSM 771]|uniref:DUF5348 domain-containing protein n=1 Tax=Desulfofarcimen acetoxidans (strain ATCC 49208 / DSM 771 / KCTC 5769 / VKM B-1644 / 5575) TaxID=485916 RepID=C8W0L0_DESAS|nr:DUF5348 domain-containing protein [Desulfofarcimen acetoxidans]ACV63265.1 hypothetical protein Dtox_2456 [Desulfofarcimen acetoxidans DSM 771]
MTKIKKMINQEVNELTVILEAVKTKIENITLLYPNLNNAKGIERAEERAELVKLIAMCEGNFSDDLAIFIEGVKQLTKPREEGRLVVNSAGRYSLNGYELTCGHRIEVFIEDENHDDYGWQFGRVEHSEKFGGYYFFNESGEHHKLTIGMLAAVRN